MSSDPVMNDLASYEAKTNRAESQELAKAALEEEEQGWILETREGMDELLAWILDRPAKSLFKQSVLDCLIAMVGKECQMPISMDEIAFRSALKVGAETLAMERTAQRMKEVRVYE